MTHQMEHSLDPEKLSAYLDDALDEFERSQVEEHLAFCAACRERLADYRWIGNSIQAIALRPVPSTLDDRVADLISRQTNNPTRRHPLSLPSFRPAIATALLVALLSAVILFGLPARDAGGPMVAAAYLYEEQGMTAIAVEFNHPVDHKKVEETLRIEPPLEVSVAWRGDTMVVKPAEPLETRINYTVRVNPLGAGSEATPVALPVLPSKPTQALATPTTRAIVAAESPTATATVTSTPSAIASSPSPTAAPISPTAGGTPEAIEPAYRFGLLLHDRPDIAGKLGKALEPESGVQMVIQPFEGGLLLWRGDRKEILALLNNGGWNSYPDTFDGQETEELPPGEPVRGFGKLWRENAELRSALGATTAPEQPIEGVFQPFEQGTIVWTADRSIYLLYADGVWERLEDTYPTSTPTAPITATPDPTGSPTPTPVPTSAVTTTPGATPSSTGTPSPSDATHTATPTAVSGTPESTPTASGSATPSPTADGGMATPTSTVAASPSPTPTPAIPRRTATPIATPTITPTATVTPTATPTPIGADCDIQPQRGFGLVYQENPRTALRLGCAKSEEVALQLVRQGFENGLMIWRSDTRDIVTLRRDGRWFVHPDTWREGEVEGDVGPAPEGMFIPQRGIGKVWRQQIVLRETLGWAVAPEQPIPGAVQQFTGGTMLWTGDRVIYVLYPDGSWRGFADTYVPPVSNATSP
ncbi:MAG: zf-HC2 domain-containing protein [Chloroflexota bacterium]|jgi:hypothetical protein